jgi:hypothetical protein
VRRAPPNKAMKLTRLAAAPGRMRQGAAAWARWPGTGPTASQLIAGVRRTGERRRACGPASLPNERNRLMRRAGPVAAVILVLTCACAAESQPATAQQQAAASRAKAIYDRFVAFDNARDMALLDLVADDATILTRSERADGQWREMRTPCREWKEMLRQVTALGGPGPAREQHSYTKCTSVIVGSSVRIACSHPESEPNPGRLSLLIGPGRDGKWLVREYVLEAPYGRR